MRWSCQVAGVGKKPMLYVSATSPVVDQGIRHLWVHSLIRDFRIIAMNVKHAVVSFLSRPSEQGKMISWNE